MIMNPYDKKSLSFVGAIAIFCWLVLGSLSLAFLFGVIYVIFGFCICIWGDRYENNINCIDPSRSLDDIHKSHENRKYRKNTSASHSAQKIIRTSVDEYIYKQNIQHKKNSRTKVMNHESRPLKDASLLLNDYVQDKLENIKKGKK
jgi:hypothetical protein